jgi:SAM-dependent methyltransferase
MKTDLFSEIAEAPRSSASADPVYEFYTNHPYPPPVGNLERDIWQDQKAHRAEYHLLWPHKEYRPDLDVLVAGCGTSQAAKYALNHPAARLVGIDVTQASIEHTEALKRKYNLTNLNTRQLPVENVGDLDQRFDVIICTGVLHHLADPDAGLRALRSVLKPDGAMYLLVYAPYGRVGVCMLEEYCWTLGIGTSKEQLKDLFAVLKGLPPHHPLFAAQGGSREFLDGDLLADALLNPRHRSYSVPQLFEFIERNELRLGRWYSQAPYLPQCGSIATTPHAKQLAALPEREQYRAMELWRGVMNNHTFVVYRDDVNTDVLKVSFDDDNYLRYVPVRVPWTRCMQERLPPGAAAVLLNQAHQFQDLFLVLNAHEKRMFDAIDGHRSIAEIVEKVGITPPARAFFEKLWWYDQVVFDTSKAQ